MKLPSWRGLKKRLTHRVTRPLRAERHSGLGFDGALCRPSAMSIEEHHDHF
jgi:hypothetical protein